MKLFVLTLMTFIVLSPSKLAPASLNLRSAFSEELIVWNVGQGQWVSLIDETRCQHFDLGGERAPWRKILAACQERVNEAYLSHWDLDHVSFLKRAAKKLHRFCLHEPPPPPPKHSLAGLSLCLSEESDGAIKVLKPEGLAKRASSNDLSRIAIVKSSVLLPGDSSTRAERRWLLNLKPFPDIKLLVLGHHGSRTSTSNALLRSIPRLVQAVASARTNRYGHPHREVQARLLLRRIALLKTEDWGNLHFELHRDFEARARPNAREKQKSRNP